MRGTIKAYSLVVSAGVIQGDDGKTYGFAEREWHGNVAPIVNDSVSFDGHSRSATQVSKQK